MTRPDRGWLIQTSADTLLGVALVVGLATFGTRPEVVAVAAVVVALVVARRAYRTSRDLPRGMWL